VLDSNITIAPGTLARAVDALTKPQKNPASRIALVHHVPFAFITKPSLGSRVEEAFLNTNHAKMYIALNTLAIDSCVMGKSNLYRKSDLDRVDASLKPHTNASGQTGLRVFGRFMAEDNMIASALWHELGLRHDLSCDIAMNAIGDMSLWDFILRRVRWIRVRKHMVLSAMLLEPLTESFFLGILMSLSVKTLTGLPIWVSLPLHFTLWLTADLDVYSSLAGNVLPLGSRTSFLIAWATRELLAFPIWFYAVVGSEVTWRGKKYHMLQNGEVRPSQSSDSGILGLFGIRTGNDNYEPLELSDD
jgi:ceramide glucosyltransferase